MFLFCSKKIKDYTEMERIGELFFVLHFIMLSQIY